MKEVSDQVVGGKTPWRGPQCRCEDVQSRTEVSVQVYLREIEITCARSAPPSGTTAWLCAGWLREGWPQPLSPDTPRPCRACQAPAPPHREQNLLCRPGPGSASPWDLRICLSGVSRPSSPHDPCNAHPGMGKPWCCAISGYSHLI